jgi:hypothetical protein
LLRTTEIKYFLEESTHPDLASLYVHDMECQVNVAQDSGTRIEGEYQGKHWHGWTDNISIWKSFRIPYNANSEPNYQDKPLTFSLYEHVEGIGMTGWDWYSRVSRWVAFDFDALVGHSNKHQSKLTIDELKAVKDAAYNLPWTTIRYSTSGKGLHIYVFVNDIETNNHTEHAGLARAILNLMSAKTGFLFESKVDICGGNMWIWHRKMVNTDGLKLIKQGDVLETVPPNWRNHIAVVSGKRKRIKPTLDGMAYSGQFDEDSFEDLISQKQHIDLDDEHKKLINYLDDSGASFWWDQDHYMLVAHTYDLKCAYEELNLRGIFDTVATGRQHGVDHNCYLFPLRRGAWAVRRYTPGTNEVETWEQDGKGWTRCFLNREPDLKAVAKAFNGVEHTSGGFIFNTAEDAQKAASQLGVDLKIINRYVGRRTKMKNHKDGRLIVEVDREPLDDGGDFNGWLTDKNNTWTRIFDVKNTNIEEVDVGSYDDIIRHVVTSDGTSYGWVVRSEKQWTEEPLAHVTAALQSMGLKQTAIRTIIGNNIFKPWMLTNFPFQPEYPGDRKWNRNAAQLRYVPSFEKDNLSYPHWLQILQHIGLGLNDVVLENPWCINNGLLNGADYLKCWIASLFQEPFEQLPYLFLWGKQNCGKSILHEALSLLMTQGYKRADQALKSEFNGELERAILCVVEETDLQQNKKAYNCIKDFVTALQISIHMKGKTPFMAPNTTHWIQCANEATACPVFDGDTRITMIHVPNLKVMVPKRNLMENLGKEAPDFLASILKLEVPYSVDRLNIPVLETEDKIQMARSSRNELQTFIAESCYHINGCMTTIAEFHEAFQKWLDPNIRYYWTKHRIGKMLPPDIPKGRNPTNSVWSYGNISLKENVEPSVRLVSKGDKLVKAT